MLVSGLFQRQVVLTLNLLFICPRHCFKLLRKCYLNIIFLSSFQSATQHNQKALFAILPSNRKVCGCDYQQRSKSRVATKGKDRYIVLNHLRVRWILTNPTARQTNVIISYNKYIILGELLQLQFSVIDNFFKRGLMNMVLICHLPLYLDYIKLAEFFIHTVVQCTNKFYLIILKQQM